MAVSTDPYPHNLAAIRDQISARWKMAFGPDPGGLVLGLTDILQVWAINVEQFRRTEGARRVENVARPTGFWHHQIESGTRAVGYARSLENDVAKVTIAAMAQDIKLKLDAADSELEESLARLLEVRAFYLSALWFRTSNSDVIRLLEVPPDLPFDLEMKAETFFGYLRSTPAIVGLTL